MTTIYAEDPEKRLKEIRERCEMQIGFLIKEQWLQIFSDLKYMVSLYDQVNVGPKPTTGDK